MEEDEQMRNITKFNQKEIRDLAFIINLGSVSDLEKLISEFNINLILDEGETALVMAARLGYLDKVKLLLAHPALKILQNNQGIGALDTALNFYHMKKKYSIVYSNEVAAIIFALLAYNKSDLHAPSSMRFSELSDSPEQEDDLINDIIEDYIDYQEIPEEDNDDTITQRVVLAGEISSRFNELGLAALSQEWKFRRAQDSMRAIKNLMNSGPTLILHEYPPDFLEGLEDFCQIQRPGGIPDKKAFDAAIVLGRIYLRNAQNETNAAKFFFYAGDVAAHTTETLPPGSLKFLTVYFKHHTPDYLAESVSRYNRFGKRAEYLVDLQQALQTNSQEAMIVYDKNISQKKLQDPLYLISEYLAGDNLTITDERLHSQLRGICKLFSIDYPAPHYHDASHIFKEIGSDGNATRAYRFYSYLLSAMTAYQIMGLKESAGKSKIINEAREIFGLMLHFYGPRYTLPYQLEVFYLIRDFMANAASYADRYHLLKVLLDFYAVLMRKTKHSGITLTQRLELAHTVFAIIKRSPLLDRVVNWEMVLDNILLSIQFTDDNQLRSLLLEQLNELDKLAGQREWLTLQLAIKTALLDIFYKRYTDFTAREKADACRHVEELTTIAVKNKFLFATDKYSILYLDELLQLPPDELLRKEEISHVLDKVLRSAVYPENKVVIDKIYKALAAQENNPLLAQSPACIKLLENASQAKVRLFATNNKNLLAGLIQQDDVLALIKLTQLEISEDHARRALYLCARLFAELEINKEKLGATYYGLTPENITLLQDMILRCLARFANADSKMKYRPLAAWYTDFTSNVIALNNRGQAQGVDIDAMILGNAEFLPTQLRNDIRYGLSMAGQHGPSYLSEKLQLFSDLNTQWNDKLQFVSVISLYPVQTQRTTLTGRLFDFKMPVMAVEAREEKQTYTLGN
jgi:hypothetical protein